MEELNLFSLILMSILYILAGLCHFLYPKFFLKITPTWVPYPKVVNLFVGLFEILLGVSLLFSYTRHFASLGIIALLIAVFPANIHHYKKSKKKGKFVWPTLLRLPLQGALIYWAYTFL